MLLQIKRHSTRSSDGTRITWQTIGNSGSTDVVIVPGSLDDGSTWRRLAALLRDEFTLHILSRRGLGSSEDSPDYSIEKEYEDILHVLAATEAKHLIGHSFGAVCSLGAALLSPDLDRLVIYEPPLPVHGPVVPKEVLTKIEAAADRQDFDSVVETGLLQAVRLPGRWVSKLREGSAWKAMIQNAGTWPREIRALHEMETGVERYSAIRIKTLLPVGERTPPHHRTAAEALLTVLADARLVQIPGSAHQGQVDAREFLAQELRSFLN